MFNFILKDSESNSRAKVNLRGVYIEEIERSVFMHVLAHARTQMYRRLFVIICADYRDAGENMANSSSVLGRSYVLEGQRNAELVRPSLINVKPKGSKTYNKSVTE